MGIRIAILLALFVVGGLGSAGVAAGALQSTRLPLGIVA